MKFMSVADILLGFSAIAVGQMTLIPAKRDNEHQRLSECLILTTSVGFVADREIRSILSVLYLWSLPSRKKSGSSRRLQR